MQKESGRIAFFT